MTGPVYLAGKEWLLPAAVVLLVGFGLVVWAYHRAPTESRVRGVCIGLKILGLILLLLCLIDPMTSAERAKPGANLLALVADNSEGLNVTDAGEKKSRAEFLQQTLKPNAGNWQAKLDNDFEVKRYSFDTRLKNLNDFAEVPAVDYASGDGFLAVCAPGCLCVASL